MDGKAVIVCSPSGAGKTTIVRHLLKQFPSLSFSVSACTRQKRSGEIEGTHYYFHTPEAFKAKIAADQFVEWEEVYKDNFYGTLKEEVHRLWSSDKVVAFDVDVKGAVSLKKQFGSNGLTIFIQPPSIQILAERLASRGSENADAIKMRMDRAEMELSYANQFDIVIVNDILENAKTEATLAVQSFLDPTT